MTATAAGFQTGRKSRTYYNTGTRLSPTWLEITHLSKESFDPGEQDVFQAKARGLAREIQDEDSAKPAKLTFSRLVEKGTTDAVHIALLASYGYGGTVYEFAVMDDAIGNTGAKGWRFWGKVTKMPYSRDVGNFTEQSFEVSEITKHNGTAIEGLIAATGGTSTTTAPPSSTTPGT